MSFEKLYNKVREIEEHEIKYKFIVICDLFKEKIICATATTKLCNYNLLIIIST
jgi:hypothetical protein